MAGGSGGIDRSPHAGDTNRASKARKGELHQLVFFAILLHSHFPDHHHCYSYIVAINYNSKT